MIAMSSSHPALQISAWPAPGRLDAVCLLRLAGRLAAARPRASAVEQVDRQELDDINRSLQGDSDAYARVIRRHQDHVSKLLWRFSRDPQAHEELVQDVFVEAYLSLATWRAEAPLAHWLARIATRVGFRHWKQAKRPAAQALPLEAWDRLADDGPDDPTEVADLVHRLLAVLPPRDRLVLTLRYLEGCSVDETADRTGWSRAVVKVQTWRARHKLQTLIEDRGLESEL